MIGRKDDQKSLIVVKKKEVTWNHRRLFNTDSINTENQQQNMHCVKCRPLALPSCIKWQSFAQQLHHFPIKPIRDETKPLVMNLAALTFWLYQEFPDTIESKKESELWLLLSILPLGVKWRYPSLFQVSKCSFSKFWIKVRSKRNLSMRKPLFHLHP